MTTFRRRWSFTLRTMFVVVTVLCCALAWLVYSMNWIRQRQLVRNQAHEKRLSVCPGVKECPVSAPGSLRFFGEEGVFWIGTPYDEGSPEILALRRLFPEAGVVSNSRPYSPKDRTAAVTDAARAPHRCD
jgi:hypothetical protein